MSMPTRGLADKIKGEKFLAGCERVKALLFLENKIYEEMVKMIESKDEEIDSNDSSSEEWLSLLKRLKLQEWIYGSKEQVCNDMQNVIVTYGHSKKTSSTSTLCCPTTLPNQSTTTTSKSDGVLKQKRQGQRQRKRK